MAISGISSNSNAYQTSRTNPFAKVKEDFENIGKALQSGDISAAKTAYSQLQKDAPAKVANTSDPLSTDITNLSKALDSSDLKAAQKAYANIQDNAAKGAASGGKPPEGGKPASDGGSRRFTTLRILTRMVSYPH